MTDELKVKIGFNKKFQAGLLVLMIKDFEFLKLVESEISTKYLDAGEAYLKLLKIITTQYKSNKKPLTIDIIRNILVKLNSVGVLTEPEVYGINSVIDLGLTLTHSEIDYVKVSAFDFFKKQVVVRAVSESIRHLDNNNYDGIYTEITNAYKKSFSVGESLGVNYLADPVIDRYSEPPRLGLWSSGFTKLDNYIEGGFAKSECYSILSPTGKGKCLGVNTEIIMSDGTIKLSQNIKTGDVLMGPDGKGRTVLSITSGKDKLYKITPLRGTPYVVNSAHLLSLKPAKGSHGIWLSNGTYIKPDNLSSPVFVEAKTLFESNITAKNHLKGWRPDAVSFTSECSSHSIPPYILGVWLGDGTSAKSEITQIPNEVAEAFKEYATSLSCGMSIRTPKPSYSIYRITKKKTASSKNVFLEELKKLNLLNNKHIPMSYKMAPIDDRLELLAGLIDTDGNISSNCYDIFQKNEHLARDIVFIGRSLGFSTSISEYTRVSKNTGFTGKYWRIRLSGKCNKIPCKLKYKQASIRQQKRNHLLTGIKIEEAGYGDYYGFELDGDKQFLLGDWQVTHNSSLLANLSVSALKAKKRVLFITLEMSQKQMCHRFDSILSGFSSFEIASSGEIQVNLTNMLSQFTEAPYVKYFCRGSLTISALRTYLDRFQNEVWKPDVVILDWLGCLKLGTLYDKKHEQLAEAADELVNISREYEITLITAHQTNRTGVSQDMFDYSAVSESFASLFGLDLVMSLGATPEALAAGRRTLGILKNRMGSDGVYIKLQGDLPGRPLTFRFKELINDDEELDLLSNTN